MAIWLRLVGVTVGSGKVRVMLGLQLRLTLPKT